MLKLESPSTVCLDLDTYSAHHRPSEWCLQFFVSGRRQGPADFIREPDNIVNALGFAGHTVLQRLSFAIVAQKQS